MTRVTQINAETVVPAAAADVWVALLDPARWRAWEHPAARLQLQDVALECETFEHMGDRRRCSAVLTDLPLGRRHTLVWDEQVTDVDPERTLEVESLPGRTCIRRWRVRFWLLNQPDGSTRLRCRVTYSPDGLRGSLLDRFFLRPRVAAAAEAWLEMLAMSFSGQPIEFEAANAHAETRHAPVAA
jgi:hypothetical protein